MDAVLSVLEAADPALPVAALALEDISSAATQEEVLAQAALETVLAAAAKLVVARATVEVVVATAATEDITPCTAMQFVGAVAAEEAILVPDADLTGIVGELSAWMRYGRSMARLLLIFVLLPTALSAQGPVSDADLAPDAVARGQILPSSDILPGLKAQFGGEVLDLELEVEDRLRVYEFEILTDDARLIEVAVDAATGEVLEVENEDTDDEATPWNATVTDAGPLRSPAACRGDRRASPGP